MLHLCAVLLVLPHMCRGSVGFASHSASSASSAPRSRGAADSAFICWFCYTFTRFCWFCLSFGAVLLILPRTPRGFASSARSMVDGCAVLLVLHSSYGSDSAGSAVLLHISRASGGSASHSTLFSQFFPACLRPRNHRSIACPRTKGQPPLDIRLHLWLWFIVFFNSFLIILFKDIVFYEDYLMMSCGLLVLLLNPRSGWVLLHPCVIITNGGPPYIYIYIYTYLYIYIYISVLLCIDMHREFWSRAEKVDHDQE